MKSEAVINLNRFRFRARTRRLSFACLSAILLTPGIFSPPSAFGQIVRYYVVVHNGTDDPDYNQVFCNGHEFLLGSFGSTIVNVAPGEVSPATKLHQVAYYGYAGTLNALCGGYLGGVNSPVDFTFPAGTDLDFVVDVYVNGAAPAEFPKEDSLVCEDGDTRDPIDTRNGNNYFSENRLFVPCPGIPLELNLNYRSVSVSTDGSLGEGWRHSLDWNLEPEPGQAVLYTGEGERWTFEEDGGGGYHSPRSSNWTLNETADGYDIGMPGGRSYMFDTNGTLSALQDAWGNTISCVYGTNGCLEAATHSNGRKIAFSNSWHSAAAAWRLTSAQVVSGAGLTFSYNSDGQIERIIEQVGTDQNTSSYHYAESILTNRAGRAGFDYAYASEPGGASGYFKARMVIRGAAGSYEVPIEYPHTYAPGQGGFPEGRGTHLNVDGFYEHDVVYGDPHTTHVSYTLRGAEQIYRYVRNAEQLLDTRYGPGETVPEALTRGVSYTYATNHEDRTATTLFDDAVTATWSEHMLYDGTHNMTSYAVAYGTTNPVNQLSLEYDAVWLLPSAIINAEGHRQEILYTNGSPLVVKSFYSSSNSYDTAYGYTANGQVRCITNANDHVFTLDYDADGNLVSLTAETGPVVTNSYDALGFLKTTEFYVDVNGPLSRRIIEFGRDAHGRIEWACYPDGLTNFYSYNALGYLTNSIDRAGRATDHTYAPDGTLISTTRYLEQGGSNVPVRIAYDLDEQMNNLKITEPLGRYVESYNLDIQNRTTAVTNIEGQVMTIDYGIGDFVRELNRYDGSSVTNMYDQAGRLSSSTYNTTGATPLTLSYTYYADGQIQWLDDGATTNSYAYDQLNRLTSVTNLADSCASVMTYQHDPLGNVLYADVEINGMQVCSVGYTYDAAERLDLISRSVTGGGTNSSFTYVYNPRNGAISIVEHNPSGITCSYDYDIMERVDAITYRDESGALIRSIDYDYNAVGMITNRTLSGGQETLTTAYGYDSIDRLTSETSSTAGSPVQTIEYVYDLAGNRLNRSVIDYVVANTLGAGNRLASWSTSCTNDVITDVTGFSSEMIGMDGRWGERWVSNLTAQVGADPQIDGTDFAAEALALNTGTNVFVAAVPDAAGNVGYATNTVVYSVITNGTFLHNTAGCVTNIAHTGTGGYSRTLDLEWDERYRLTSVSSGFSVVDYGYDALGRRIRCSVGSASQTNTTYFVYDGSQVIADVDASGNLLRSYTWGPGIDNLLCFTDHVASATYYVIKDIQNTIIALVDGAGEVVETYEYDAFGRMTIYGMSGLELSSSSYGNRYGFQGREFDWITGLYYFRARWYNPETGRWLSKDPIGIEGGLNQFEAFGNNPVNAIDPFGLDVAYLIASRDVGGAGHGAAAVGNDQSGWTYYSFGPGRNPFSISDNLDVKQYTTFADLMADNPRYDNSKSFITDAVADAAAHRRARKYKRLPYWPLSRNCDDAASDILRAAGIDLDDNLFPNHTFRNLKCSE